MNGAQLQAWVNAHKPQVALAGLAGVAGLVLWRKNHPATATPGGQYSSAPATGLPYSVGAGPYDSTANDVYNSLQGVLEQLQNTADEIAGAGPTAPPVTVAQPIVLQTPTGPVSVAAPPTGSVPVIGPGGGTVTYVPVGGPLPVDGTVPVGGSGGTVTITGGVPTTITDPAGGTHPAPPIGGVTIGVIGGGLPLPTATGPTSFFGPGGKRT